MNDVVGVTKTGKPGSTKIYAKFIFYSKGVFITTQF